MANFVNETFGISTMRRNYAKTKNNLKVTNLLEVQTSAFEKFIKKDIDEVFKEIYPIHSTKDKIVIEYIDFKIEWPSNIDEEIRLSKKRGVNLQAPIKARFRMINNKKGEVYEDEVFVVNMPLMTSGGGFIINGSKRIIISQITRSPGVYYENMKAARNQSTSDSSVFKLATIIPNRGSWIEWDYKNYKLLNLSPSGIKLKIDKSKRFNASLLFNAFGLNDDKIRELFSDEPVLLETLNKVKEDKKDPFEARAEIFRIVSTGERTTKKSINELLTNLFFNPKRYHLSETGRYKFNNKLSVLNRVYNKYLAEDILDADKNVLIPRDTFISKEEFKILKEAIETNNLDYEVLPIDSELFENSSFSEEEIKEMSQIHNVFIYKDNNYEKSNNLDKIKIVGNRFINEEEDKDIITISDIIASFGYLINLEQGLLKYDDIDSLSNRKLRNVGELLKNQFRIGLTRVEKNVKERISAKDTSSISIKNTFNYKLMESAIKEFFNSSQFSQFMDQINPLAEISNKRRITSLGPGGLSRDTASLVVRGIHDTHYGRIDPIETPEGPNIGLILNLAIYAKVNRYGLIETPYFKVKDGKVLRDEIIYLSADNEGEYYIASGVTLVDDDNRIFSKVPGQDILARHFYQFTHIPIEKIQLIDAAPNQIVSIATSHIPFLEHNDANRALMGANMQRQAVPLIETDSPIVGTGIEESSAFYSPTTLKSTVDGVVLYVDSRRIVIEIDDDSKTQKTYYLEKFERSNQATSINQRPVVFKGDKIKKDQIIADGPSVDNGELAIGKNILVAFTTWKGYNYEDAIIVSERLIQNDTFTSIHLEDHRVEQRTTKLGQEKITFDIPNASKTSMRNLDDQGIVIVGSEVKVGDILVGKVTPKGDDELSAEEKLLDAILGNKTRNIKDTSLRVPYSGGGIVKGIEILSRENGDKLEDGVEKVIKIYIAQKRKLKEGDKMSGRHGNKGVVSRILPLEDMPHLEDGTPIDIMLNPLGVPSRMNIGQVMEIHLGIAAKMLGLKISTPIFSGVSHDDLEKIMEEAGMDKTGKFTLINGLNGKPFDEKVAVGIMYMLKLSHMIDDKMHARAIGPYSLITQQPLRGKSQNGGQRFGEMEAWAVEAYGAANILQEMVTLKSDDISGRNELYNAIAKSRDLPLPSIPEGLWVLYYELKGLGLTLNFLDENEEEIEVDNSI